MQWYRKDVQLMMWDEHEGLGIWYALYDGDGEVEMQEHASGQGTLADGKLWCFGGSNHPTWS